MRKIKKTEMNEGLKSLPTLSDANQNFVSPKTLEDLLEAIKVNDYIETRKKIAPRGIIFSQELMVDIVNRIKALENQLNPPLNELKLRVF